MISKQIKKMADGFQKKEVTEEKQILSIETNDGSKVEMHVLLISGTYYIKIDDNIVVNGNYSGGGITSANVKDKNWLIDVFAELLSDHGKIEKIN